MQYFNTNIAPLLTPASQTGNAIFFYQDDKVLYIGCSGTMGTTAPSGAVYPGTAGMMAFDSSYAYVCHATDSWKRVAISTF